MLGSRLSTSRKAVAHVASQHSRAMSLAAPEKMQGLFASIFNRSSMPPVSLDTPFPGVEAITPGEAAPVKTETSTLENGMRVVSVDSSSPIASVGVFVDSGSRHESEHTSGISHFLEYFAFRSTENRSDFKLVRDMLKIGANVVCSTSREHTVYAADALREHTPSIVNTLADVIQHPAFHLKELREAHAGYMAAAEERQSMADVKITEGIHAAAYHNNTLGLPLYAPSHMVPYFTGEVLENHMKTFFMPSRMVVSGVGVDHAQLVDLVSKEFGELKDSGAAPATTPAQYTGGDVRIHNAAEPLAHVAIAFETASWHSKDLVPMCVLQMMMGGGGSFSAGGPGKGMYSRLYQNVLNQYGWVESANCFNSIFSDSSIFGVYGTSAPQQADSLVDVLTKECTRMADKVDSTELSRAKNQLKSSVHMQLETRALKLEDLGRQMITYNKIQTADELCKSIDAVSETDIQRVAQAMLKTPVSVAGFGNLSYAPRYEVISKRFG